MNHLSLSLFLCLFVSACFVQAADRPSTQKPNILIYLADDLGYGSINSYGTAIWTGVKRFTMIPI